MFPSLHNLVYRDDACLHLWVVIWFEMQIPICVGPFTVHFCLQSAIHSSDLHIQDGISISVPAEEGPWTETSFIVEILLRYQCSTSHLNSWNYVH